MIIILHNYATGQESAVERRAAASAEATRKIVLDEVDRWLPPNWRREHLCTVYIDQPCPVGWYSSRAMLDLNANSWKHRCRKDFRIEACISRKSAAECADIASRLAVAMAYDRHTSGRSKLAQLDTMVFHLILKFTGLVE